MTIYLSSALGMTHGWMDDRLICQKEKSRHFYTILKRACAIYASHSLGLSVLAFLQLVMAFNSKSSSYGHQAMANCKKKPRQIVQVSERQIWQKPFLDLYKNDVILLFDR